MALDADISDTAETAGDPKLEAFAAEARAFVAQHAPARPPAAELVWGEGPDVISAIGGSSDEPEELAKAQAWRALLFDNGYGWLSGPTEYGGGGYDVAYEDRFAQVLDEFDTPDQGIFSVARGMVAPAVQEHGSAELKERYLRRIHRGELIAAQLLSEPEADSDLGGLKTRAVRDGDEWVVNGQKVWSSNAHVAQLGQLLCRTDPDAPKHRGISMFMLDLDTPGVEVRPLRQMNGEAHFNEIFLSDVRVPHANMVGDPGGGWRAVITTLMNERHVVATGNGSRSEFVEKLFALARHKGATKDPVIRQRLAEVHTYDRLLRYLALRQEAALAAGAVAGPEGSIGKLLYSGQLKRVGVLAAELAGPAFAADNGEWGTFAWSGYLNGTPGLRIAGGTDEIQRNTLGERALGLPKEPDPSKTAK